MLEDLNTVHALTKEIERLREGEEPGEMEGAEPTPGQLWRKLLDMKPSKRIETLATVLEMAGKGVHCTLSLHDEDLERQHHAISSLWNEHSRWARARRLIAVYIAALRKDQQAAVERGTVADRLEIFLKTGEEGPVKEPGRVLCDYRWNEAGLRLSCIEPVDGEGGHPGEHHAFVREGDAADRELRMKYLEDENDALRKRLGLPLNRRTTE